jgi:hypothetical protein
MPWSRIEFAEGFDSPSCQWVGTVFQQLYLHAPDHEFDALALYRSTTHIEGVTLYFSARATAKLRAAMSRFDLIDCPRPEASQVKLVLGHPMAADPSWCDLSPLERLAEAEEAYASIEVIATPEAERQVS